MTSKPKSPEARERLAAALRENLKRRKARARALAAGPTADPAAPLALQDGADAPEPPPSDPETAPKPGR